MLKIVMAKKREKVLTFCALKTTISYGPRNSLIREQWLQKNGSQLQKGRRSLRHLSIIIFITILKITILITISRSWSSSIYEDYRDHDHYLHRWHQNHYDPQTGSTGRPLNIVKNVNNVNIFNINVNIVSIFNNVNNVNIVNIALIPSGGKHGATSHETELGVFSSEQAKTGPVWIIHNHHHHYDHHQHNH